MFQMILYHLLPVLYTQGLTREQKELLKAVKQQVISGIRELTGLIIDVPTSADGNTNTGPLAM